MESKHYYNVHLKWENGRVGEVSSPELKEVIKVATPPQFPEGVEGVWSPEHLFTAAVNSCFMTTFLAIAQNSKLNFVSLHVNSKGGLAMVDGKWMMTDVELFPVLGIADEKDRERAERILKKAEAACLISNSIKSTVTMVPAVLTETEVV